MEGTTIALIFMAYFVMGILVVIALTWKWTFFGLKLFIRKMFGKVGLHFIEDLSGDFGMPHIIDLNKSEHKYGTSQYVITKEQIGGPRMFGMPFIMHNSEDTKTNAGIYYAENDKRGLPNGNLIQVKPSITLPPPLLRAIVHTKALTLAIEELFSKHRTQIYLLMGIGVALAVSIYFSYEAYNKLPAIFETLKAIETTCGGGSVSVVPMK
jgi:hypothetical protein